VVILLCIFVGTFFLFKSKPTGFIPQEDEGRLYITYELPEAASTARSLVTLTKMMEYRGFNAGHSALCCPWAD
jgi:HAE1 family hydrophobic/amphiphilic exporter-1